MGDCEMGIKLVQILVELKAAAIDIRNLIQIIPNTIALVLNLTRNSS